MRNISKLLTHRRGATAIEYALIASLISVAAISAYHGLGDQVSGSFTNVSNTVGAVI